ncbi:hypothetical protein AHAS_Ahas03G0215100 [Arachis hypogaea]
MALARCLALVCRMILFSRIGRAETVRHLLWSNYAYPKVPLLKKWGQKMEMRSESLKKRYSTAKSNWLLKSQIDSTSSIPFSLGSMKEITYHLLATLPSVWVQISFTRYLRSPNIRKMMISRIRMIKSLKVKRLEYVIGLGEGCVEDEQKEKAPLKKLRRCLKIKFDEFNKDDTASVQGVK